MTYIAQLAGMVLSGFVLVLIVHWVIIYIHEPRGHYLVRVLNFLEGIFPEELIIIGFACAFIVSFAMMFVAPYLVIMVILPISGILLLVVGCTAWFRCTRRGFHT